MKVIWNQVTRLSQWVAIILFVLVFYTGLVLGRSLEERSILGEPVSQATFACPGGEKISTEFFERMVHAELPRVGSVYLPQTISASGARYADKAETLVFWNKGDSIFVDQDGQRLYTDCVAVK